MRKASNQKVDIKSIFFAAMAWYGAALITVLLAFRFYVMLFFPGTVATEPIFRFLDPTWKYFSLVCLLLKIPVEILLKYVPPHSLIAFKSVFPHMSAALLMSHITHKPLAECKALYPGQAEWLTLLAILFWDILLLGIYQGYAYLRDNLDFNAVLEESRLALAQQKRGLQQLKEQMKVKRSQIGFKSQPEHGEEPALDNGSQDARTLDRLTKSRAEVGMPIIIKPTMADWEQYKETQGNLMVNEMLRQLRKENAGLHAQQDNLRSTFSRYFSPMVLQYLETNKGAFQTLHNEKHIVSVIFCDIRGFSSYSQKASSDEVVSFLSEYFEIASHSILHRYNGVIGKLMGDGLMAYWGFPLPNESHAYTATQAALDILRQVDQRNRYRPNDQPLNIGIGIATGEAIVGNIGSSDFKDFTLIGAPVNMAARLEEANKTLKTRLLISEETYKGLQGRIPCQDCGKIAIRGWEQPEHVYAPVIQ